VPGLAPRLAVQVSCLLHMLSRALHLVLVVLVLTGTSGDVSV